MLIVDDLLLIAREHEYREYMTKTTIGNRVKKYKFIRKTVYPRIGVDRKDTISKDGVAIQ